MDTIPVHKVSVSFDEGYGHRNQPGERPPLIFRERPPTMTVQLTVYNQFPYSTAHEILMELIRGINERFAAKENT